MRNGKNPSGNSHILLKNTRTVQCENIIFLLFYLLYARHYKLQLVCFFYPISKDHLCTVTFGLMYGLYSRAASNQERLMMVHDCKRIFPGEFIFR